MRHRTFLSGFGLAVLAVFFLLVTVGLDRLPSVHVDLSDQKLHTLSDGAKKIIQNIQEPIHLQYFFSDKTSRAFPEIRNYAKRVQEKLTNFSKNSRGKIQLTVIDPEPFSEAEDKATQFGLQGVPISAAGDALYHGLVATNSLDGQEVIPFFMPDKEELLEYQIASILYKLDHPQKPILGILTTLSLFGEVNPQTGQPTRPLTILEQLSEQFEIRYLDANVKAIDKDISTLLVIQPNDLSSEALYAIDQLAMRGGKICMLVDPFSEAKQTNPAIPQNALIQKDSAGVLQSLLTAWGVSFSQNKIVADQPYALSIRMPGAAMPVKHVAILGYQKNQFNKQDPIIANLNNLNISTAGVLKSIEKKSVQFTPLVQSSQDAMLIEKERFNVIRDPSLLMLGYKPSGERYTLAARVDGFVQTAFMHGAPGGEAQVKAQPNGKHLDKAVLAFHAVIVSDTDLLLDRMWIFYQDFFGQKISSVIANNSDFVMNTLAHLSGSDALISIRGRGRFARPFLRLNALQSAAERVFKNKERDLKQRLEEAEFKLTELQRARENTQSLTLTPEQTQTLQAFLRDKMQIRKELRSVQHGLNQSVEKLGTILKIINIGLMPVLVSIVALLVAWFRIKRRESVEVKHA